MTSNTGIIDRWRESGSENVVVSARRALRIGGSRVTAGITLHSGDAERVAPRADEFMVEIREEAPGDIIAIRDVNKRAFGQDQEGNIIDALRSNGASLLSLVATLNGRVVGHIMYSPAFVGEVAGAALGPKSHFA